ncbi:MAG: hypothetical protein C0631_01775 [Sedimenticola sp.]|nr:MAG: hypothetical protein C0631_01775 [Sedimenticola sp.]
MNIGLSPQLRPMVRRFMEVCLRRLPIRRVHLYLCYEADAELPKGASPGSGNTLRISMPEGGMRVRQHLGKIEGLIASCSQADGRMSEPSVIEDEGRYFHLFPMMGMGTFVMERLNAPLQDDLIRALVPIFERLNLGCNAALQHERVIREVSRRKEAEEHIEHLAYHDDLTGLSNRRDLLVHLDAALGQVKDTGRHGVLLYVDLDNFRDINESLGYAIGDAIIREVAGRLGAIHYQELCVARLGSDEFVILWPLISGPADKVRQRAVQLASTVQAAISEPSRVDNRSLAVAASVGIVLFSDGEISGDMLLGQGSLAMYQAKALGRNTLHFFEAGMAADAEKRLMLDSEMRVGLRDEQFNLYLQPQVDQAGEMIGAEALIRWQHPQKGLVSPATFIPMAEKSGFIVPLSDWVLRRACDYVNQLEAHQLLPDSGYIAVNLSAKYFHQADFVTRVRRILSETGVAPGRLEFELTEGTLLNNVDDAINKMYRMRELGVGFSIDDFGTGYSSLSYIKQLPIDRIKIDRSFVRNVDSSPGDAAIIETIIAMAGHFNLGVIAEGVENEAEWQFLAGLGCKEFQGFLFHKPMPFEVFLDEMA